MALYAGESVDSVTRIQPASEIVAELTANLSSSTSERRLVLGESGRNLAASPNRGATLATPSLRVLR